MMAPAPYSAPAAYYSPRIGRMSGVEILKGSSQVRYGPQTTGGVINYLATPFLELPEMPAPELLAPGGKNPAGKNPAGAGKGPVAEAAAPGEELANEFYLKSTYGSFNTWYNHGWWGRTQKTESGTVGMVLELFHNQSDGYRSIAPGCSLP